MILDTLHKSGLKTQRDEKQISRRNVGVSRIQRRWKILYSADRSSFKAPVLLAPCFGQQLSQSDDEKERGGQDQMIPIILT